MDGPLPILLWGSITLIWTQFLVLRYFLLEPAVFLAFWSVMGQVWQRVSLACVVYHSQCVKVHCVELPMKENVSGYLLNPCSLRRERDVASDAKLLFAVDMLIRQENLRGKMVRTRVYVKHVWRRGGISRHQPMNWRDSIWQGFSNF